jgi:hypothetical protein
MGGKSKRQLADEAYRRVVEGSPQIDLTEQIALEEQEAKGPPPPIADLSTCPSCGRKQTARWGWTVNPSQPGSVVCGNCGRAFVATERDWKALMMELRAFAVEQAARLAPLPKKDKGQKRARGGG